VTVITDELLRPQYLSQVIGMPKIKTRLRTVITAALKTGAKLENVLLSGPAGCGKSLLAHVIAREMGLNTAVTTGADLAKDAYQVKRMVVHGSLLFIDEIHQLSKKSQDILLPWLEQGQVKMTWWEKKGTRYVGIDKKADFICIGATTQVGRLQDPFVQRFKLHLILDLYSVNDLAQIAARSAQLLQLNVVQEGLRIIAERSKGTPRITNSILWYIQQYSIANSCRRLEKNDVLFALKELGVGKLGLTEQDRRYLKRLARSNKPVGLTTLALSLSESPLTLQTIEGYLMRQELVEVTSRGRQLTINGVRFLKGEP